MERCRRECASRRDCPAGSECVLDDSGLGSCLFDDEVDCSDRAGCPSPLVCDEGRCVNECGPDRGCPPGSRCTDAGRCASEPGQTCRHDSECPVDRVCGRDGRCRRQCLEDRDCAEGLECALGTCRPIDGGGLAPFDDGGTSDPDGGMDAAVSDAGVPDAASDAASPEAGALDASTSDSGADGAVGSDAGGSLGDGGGPDDAGPAPEPVFCSEETSCAPAPHATVACETGECVVDACEPPFLDCDGAVQNGCEANPEANRWHCGGCGLACGADEVCLAESCVAASVRSLCASWAYTCALWTTGQVTCWGLNDRGQLGDGATVIDRAAPVMVAGIDDAEGLACGGNHTCVWRTTGEVSCWGADHTGQLGDGGPLVSGEFSNTPVVAAGLTDAVGVAAGFDHTCAWTSEGHLWCWGSNGFGRLGDGTTTSRSSPTLVTVGGVALGGVTSVTAADSHTCALAAEGPHCWGRNLSGRLGDGTTTTRRNPTPVSMPAGESFVALATGGSTTFGVTPDGRVYCWGFNANQECGMSTVTTPFLVPEESPWLSGVQALTNRCARMADDTVRCWGSNFFGQAGLGTREEPVDLPELVPLAPGSMVATSSNHTCLLLETGALRCVGRNLNGQLGRVLTSSFELGFGAVEGLP